MARVLQRIPVFLNFIYFTYCISRRSNRIYSKKLLQFFNNHGDECVYILCEIFSLLMYFVCILKGRNLIYAAKSYRFCTIRTFQFCNCEYSDYAECAIAIQALKREII